MSFLKTYRSAIWSVGLYTVVFLAIVILFNLETLSPVIHSLIAKLNGSTSGKILALITFIALLTLFIRGILFAFASRAKESTLIGSFLIFIGLSFLLFCAAIFTYGYGGY